LYDHLNDDGRDTDKIDNVNLGCAGAQYAPVCAAHKAAMIAAGWRQADPVLLLRNWLADQQQNRFGSISMSQQGDQTRN
jgi:hypothetical protein